MAYKRNKFTRKVGRRVEKARKAKGWSRSRLAELTGLSATAVTRMEEGFNCTLVTFKAVCDALELRVGEVLR